MAGASRDIIVSSLPVTLWVIATSIILALVIAVPLAALVATARHSSMPYIFRAITSALLAIPAFFTALIALMILGVHYGVAPIIGYEASISGQPLLRLAARPGHLHPSRARFVSGSIQLDQGHNGRGIRGNRVVRGVGRVRFYWFYLLRPSLAPSVVLLSYMVGVMVGATVIIETIFSLPGIGRALVGAVIGRDYPVVQGCVLLFGLSVVIVNLCGDVFASWLDPRLDLK